MKISLILVVLLLTSCNTGSSKKGSLLDQSKDKIILDQEIDDEIIERDVSSVRNSTRLALDLDKAVKSSFKERYFHEDPYYISFLRNDEILQYQLFNLKDVDVEAFLKRFIITNPEGLSIKSMKMGGTEIKYLNYDYNSRIWIVGLKDSKSKNEQMLIKISSKRNMDPIDLIKEYNFIITDF